MLVTTFDLRERCFIAQAGKLLQYQIGCKAQILTLRAQRPKMKYIDTEAAAPVSIKFCYAELTNRAEFYIERENDHSVSFRIG
jgi:hypothetical protein